MDESEIKHIVEAALLAAGRPLTVDRLVELFTKKGGGPDRAAIKRALDALSADYQARGIEIKEVASGFRVQVKRSMSDWLAPLWEERAPRYTRALLETLALVAYRQPITRAEIEEVRGVVVSTNIVRTLLERGWIRVVGHRDVPGKPAMFGTTREFLDYFGLKRLEDLPPLAEIKDGFPELSPQTDLIESLDTGPHLTVVGDEDTEAAVEIEPAEPIQPAEVPPMEEASGIDGEAEPTSDELDAAAPTEIVSEESAAPTFDEGSTTVMDDEIDDDSVTEMKLLDGPPAPEMPADMATAVEAAINAALAAGSTDAMTDDSVADDSGGDDVEGEQPGDDDDPATDGEREALRAKSSD